MAPRRLLKLAAAPLLLGGVLWLARPEKVLLVLGHAHEGWLLAGFLAALAANVLSACRWQRLCLWLGLQLPGRGALSAYFQGVAANVLLPGATVGGDMLRAAQVVRLGNPAWESGWSVLLDRLSGLWVLCVLSAAALAAWLGVGREVPGLAAWLPGGAGAGAWAGATALLGLLLPPLLYLWGRHGLLPLLSQRWRELFCRLLARPGPARLYLQQLWLSCLVQLLSAGALACAGFGLGLDLAPAVFLIVAAPIFVMAALPVSFGGWGTREAAAAVSFGFFGAAADLAVGTSLVYGLYAVGQALLAIGMGMLPRRSGN